VVSFRFPTLLTREGRGAVLPSHTEAGFAVILGNLAGVETAVHEVIAVYTYGTTSPEI
jgi:hypothetical protein